MSYISGSHVVGDAPTSKNPLNFRPYPPFARKGRASPGGRVLGVSMNPTPKPLPTQERIREVFDYREGQLFWKIRPNVRILIGTRAGRNLGGSTRAVSVDGTEFLEHRIIWVWHNGDIPTGMVVDHINGNSGNNRIENLRIGTLSENQQNRRNPQKNGKSGFLGVSKGTNPKDTTWKCQITVGGKIHVKCGFASPELAHAYYLRMKRILHPFGTL